MGKTMKNHKDEQRAINTILDKLADSSIDVEAAADVILEQLQKQN